MSSNRPLKALLWLIYPTIIYFGLNFFEPRTVACLLTATHLLHRRRSLTRLLAGLARIDHAILFAIIALSLLTIATNSEALLRLYPAAINMGMLLLFGISLFSPPTLVERIARLDEPDLPPAGVRYTRRVTQVWCVFFACNGTVAIWTALYANRDQWALYNGLIAYVLMGTLFAAEYLIRRRALASRIAR